ncbi:geranylgeranylglycerol-phosphate geranylgeranyltransferase [Pseudofulvibacter geojedonensis]|uniref:Geranylgeranylglycerol-phosphate geranylgeranyltransferase n=1 Tax=Pseudofulvibacter geojedonensis TaxID=1123758 RepID=A0ABW3I2F1_9FLAO
MQILQLIRFKNLFMIAFIQCLLKYVFFALPQFQNIPTALNTNNFTLLVLATICIAAAGYIINDIYDVQADNINKPKKVFINKGISESLANNLFMGFTILGIVLGTYVSWQIGKNSFATIFLLVSALLYFYATSLKQTILVGNIVISAIVSLSVLIVGIFEIAPMVTPETKDAYLFMFKFLIDYALFAFLINLVRELVKDLEDIDGDYKAGYNTLPIAIGRNRASKIAFALCLLTIITIFYYTITYLFENQYLLLYFIFVIIGPLAYCAIKLITAKHKKHFTHISLILKITMLLGMLSIVLLKFV